MARLQIRWQTRSEVAPRAAATGAAQEQEAAASARVSDKPLFVFVTHDDPENGNMRKLQDVVFANEKLAIAAKFFDTIQVSAADAARDRILKDAIQRNPPCLIFMRRDYTVHTVVNEHQLSAGRILSAMSRLVRETFENDFDRTVRDYMKLLNERDRLESVRARIEDQRNRYADRPDRLAKLEKDVAEFEQDMAEWEKKEQEVLSFQVRGGSETSS